MPLGAWGSACVLLKEEPESHTSVPDVLILKPLAASGRIPVGCTAPWPVCMQLLGCAFVSPAGTPRRTKCRHGRRAVSPTPPFPEQHCLPSCLVTSEQSVPVPQLHTELGKEPG